MRRARQRYVLSPDRLEGVREGATIRLPEEAAHHVARVVRLREGELVAVTDGGGRSFLVRLRRVDARAVEGEVLGPEYPEGGGRDPEPHIAVDLAFALLKGDRSETVLALATEIGVRRFRPFFSARTVVRPEGDARRRREERFRAVVREAVELSGRTHLPPVEPIAPFGDVLTVLPSYAAAFVPYELAAADRGGVYPHLLEAYRSLAPAASRGPILLVIGPEGGFTPEEAETAQDAGAHLVSLGPRILRAETAAVFAVSLLLGEETSLSSADNSEGVS
ncbi:MAG: 16S rRNA (uracil(1498)-N(3))-methyltransferase [Brockia lithotrophica]|nr:16S rRNA (uracil(1498)-N(3))-methyltransferase [Brockia lithotrophica]